MKILIVAVILGFCATSAFADDFRCPNGNIVSSGDSISTVAVKCDKPDFVARREEPVQNDYGRTMYIEVQEWTYTKGSTLIHTLEFRNGILTRIRTGGFVQ